MELVKPRWCGRSVDIPITQPDKNSLGLGASLVRSELCVPLVRTHTFLLMRIRRRQVPSRNYFSSNSGPCGQRMQPRIPLDCHKRLIHRTTTSILTLPIWHRNKYTLEFFNLIYFRTSAGLSIQKVPKYRHLRGPTGWFCTRITWA